MWRIQNKTIFNGTRRLRSEKGDRSLMWWPIHRQLVALEIQRIIVPGFHLLLCFSCSWFIADIIAVMSYAVLIAPIPSSLPGDSRSLRVQILFIVNIAIGDWGAIWITDCQISILGWAGSFFKLVLNHYYVSYSYHGGTGTWIAYEHLNLVSNWTPPHSALYHNMQYIFIYHYLGDLFYCSAFYCLLFV